jgi:hypothetical protein
MNALLSVLAPSPEAREIHKRMALVLACSRHELLQAKAEVWEPGETPEPKPERKARRMPKRPPTGTAAHDIISAHLSETPITLRALMKATGLKPGAVNTGIYKLLTTGRARNLSRTGHVGQYVKVATQARGVFDV